MDKVRWIPAFAGMTYWGDSEARKDAGRSTAPPDQTISAVSYTHLDVYKRQIYERVFVAAREALPQNSRAYIVKIARNYLIDRARRARIVSFELVADLEDVHKEVDVLSLIHI